MLSRVFSATTVGLAAQVIEVEVDVAARGMPSVTIVGLPDKAVQEAKDRVRAALQNSGSDIPPKRIIINLAPADIPKQGPAFDLPIAVGILAGKGEVVGTIENFLFCGELSLDGSLRRVNGVLSIALKARDEGFERLYVPEENAQEAAVVEGIAVYGMEHIKDVVAHVNGMVKREAHPLVDIGEILEQPETQIDMSDIHGQEQAKRAMEIAAAGGHNVFLNGLPGAGKTMLCRAFAGILPRLTKQEALEVTKIYSVSGQLPADEPIMNHRPFRSPHHTTSRVGLIGGGSIPLPGEISLAHRGVLFLDEFPEFARNIIESLRQPLEDGVVTISRAAQTNTYPCRFILIAAANPCPCGFMGSSKHSCSCTAAQIHRYHKKISGPIIDRIDLHVTVAAVKVEKLTNFDNDAESSSEIRQRVQQARNRQRQHFTKTSLVCNAEMSTKQVKRYCPLDEESGKFMKQATERLGLSARSYFKTIKVARTIADLEGDEDITTAHLAEALQYRAKER